jgi:hypothetical protein
VLELTATIRSPRIATAPGPSKPVAGQMTRPARMTRSGRSGGVMMAESGGGTRWEAGMLQHFSAGGEISVPFLRTSDNDL